MRDIVICASREIENYKTLILNKIVYQPIKRALIESNISHVNPSQKVDALIFTSRHAIISLAKEIKRYPEMSEFLEIPSFVIGESSAQTLNEYGFSTEFVGLDSHGDGFAGEIIPLLKNRKPLYFRAKKIISGLDEKLNNAKIPLKQIIAYENRALNLPLESKPAPRSILIFSAPSHYYSFLQNFGWDGSYLAIAIGFTTFSAFNSDTQGFISQKQTIKSCIEFAEHLKKILP